ncbi:MAG: 2-C-methyl-D-erythritol 4-phosphate cytidylyltransferase [Phycisphaerales bacterium]|nr:2-C-methyl-D-erythritol 4-phosphate cytidylyltransferase [Phycisphaerales bacterium]
MPKYAVIVPAAGSSQRFGGVEKKPFAKLDGRAVFLRTLEAFINRDDVCQTILVIGSEDLDKMRSSYGANLAFMNVRLIEGGARRCDSVANALREVKDEAEYVAIHDAVRPCVSQDMIDAVFTEAVKTGAAILASPVSATLKRVSDAKVVEETISREGLYEAQTPQVFRKSLLLDAYQKLDMDAVVTDDAQLVEQIGHPVGIVQSDASNLKITVRADLTLAAAIIKSRPAKTVRKMGAFEEAQW